MIDCDLQARHLYARKAFSRSGFGMHNQNNFCTDVFGSLASRRLCWEYRFGIHLQNLQMLHPNVQFSRAQSFMNSADESHGIGASQPVRVVLPTEYSTSNSDQFSLGVIDTPDIVDDA